jgi:hypothetical protein
VFSTQLNDKIEIKIEIEIEMDVEIEIEMEMEIECDQHHLQRAKNVTRSSKHCSVDVHGILLGYHSTTAR